MSKRVSNDEAREFLISNGIVTSDEMYPEAIAITAAVLSVFIDVATQKIAKRLVDELLEDVNV